MTNEQLRTSAPDEFWRYMYKDKPLQTRSGIPVNIYAQELKGEKLQGRRKSRKQLSG